MKQLEALSNIMEVADAQMFKHLVETGSDSFLFAFRMLLVLFRRELTFGEGLYMWEVWIYVCLCCPIQTKRLSTVCKVKDHTHLGKWLQCIHTG